MCYVVKVTYTTYVGDWCIWDERLSYRYVLGMTLYIMCMSMSLVIWGCGSFVECVNCICVSIMGVDVLWDI